MNLTKEQAETAITLSALVTVGLFSYRKIVEPEVKEETAKKAGFVNDYKAVFGTAPPISWGQYLKAAGSLYIVLAILGAASPPLGGGLAILVGTTAAFGNLKAVEEDLHRTGQEQIGASQAVTDFGKGSTGQPPTSGHVLRNANEAATSNAGTFIQPTGQAH